MVKIISKAGLTRVSLHIAIGMLISATPLQRPEIIRALLAGERIYVGTFCFLV